MWIVKTQTQKGPGTKKSKKITCLSIAHTIVLLHTRQSCFRPGSVNPTLPSFRYRWANLPNIHPAKTFAFSKIPVGKLSMRLTAAIHMHRKWIVFHLIDPDHPKQEVFQEADPNLIRIKRNEHGGFTARLVAPYWIKTIQFSSDDWCSWEATGRLQSCVHLMTSVQSTFATAPAAGQRACRSTLVHN